MTASQKGLCSVELVSFVDVPHIVTEPHRSNFALL